jgi:hypothetical protein
MPIGAWMPRRNTVIGGVASSRLASETATRTQGDLITRVNNRRPRSSRRACGNLAHNLLRISQMNHDNRQRRDSVRMFLWRSRLRSQRLHRDRRVCRSTGRLFARRQSRCSDTWPSIPASRVEQASKENPRCYSLRSRGVQGFYRGGSIEVTMLSHEMTAERSLPSQGTMPDGARTHRGWVDPVGMLLRLRTSVRIIVPRAREIPSPDGYSDRSADPIKVWRIFRKDSEIGRPVFSK